MDLLGLIKVFARQWMITVPLLVVVVVLAVVVQNSTEDVFEASGSVVIAEAPIAPSMDPIAMTRPATVARQLRLTDAFRDLIQSDETAGVVVDGTGAGALEISVTGAPAEEMEEAATALAALAADIVATVQDEAEVAQQERVSAVVQRVDLVPTGAETDTGAPIFTAVTEVYLDDPLGGGENPLSATPGTARLLEVSSQSDAARSEVSERVGADIEFEVVQDINDRAPILDLLVFAESRQLAAEGFEGVVETLAQDLDDRQARAGVRSTDRLVIDVLAAPGEARDVSPPISRAVAAVIAIGLLAAVLAAVLAENLGRNRENRQGPAVEPGAMSSDDARTDRTASPLLASSTTTDAGDRGRGPNPPAE